MTFQKGSCLNIFIMEDNDDGYCIPHLSISTHYVPFTHTELCNLYEMPTMAQPVLPPICYASIPLCHHYFCVHNHIMCTSAGDTEGIVVRSYRDCTFVVKTTTTTLHAQYPHSIGYTQY